MGEGKCKKTREWESSWAEKKTGTLITRYHRKQSRFDSVEINLLSNKTDLASEKQRQMLKHHFSSRLNLTPSLQIHLPSFRCAGSPGVGTGLICALQWVLFGNSWSKLGPAWDSPWSLFMRLSLQSYPAANTLTPAPDTLIDFDFTLNSITFHFFAQKPFL